MIWVSVSKKGKSKAEVQAMEFWELLGSRGKIRLSEIMEPVVRERIMKTVSRSFVKWSLL
jgi:hypothetical protein